MLDIIIKDARIKLQTLEDMYQVKTIPYDSDHNAISTTIINITDTELVIKKEEPQNSYNFKGSDWQEFKKHITQNKPENIPPDQNLSNEDIDKYIHNLEVIIKNSMESTILKVKKSNATDKFLNKKIKQLQQNKSFLLTQIHKEKYHSNQVDSRKVTKLKKLLTDLKRKLQDEFTTSISEYWCNRIRAISHRKSEKMFPSLNAVFRKKNPPIIHTLKIEESSSLIEQAQINTEDHG